MSSCYLLDSPADDLEAIYNRYTDIALLSKFSGGIGVSYSRVRARGSLIRSTNGQSNGIIPWLKTLDSSVVAVNQGGKRKGACAVYLETWHADIEEFLELRDNTGDAARRAHNLHLAQLDPRPVHETRARGRHVVSLRPEEHASTHRPATARPSKRPISKARKRSSSFARSRRATCTRA